MLGQLEELKRRELKLRVQMDAVVKTMLHSFGPLDRDFKYLDDINPEHLQVYIDDLRKKKIELTGVVATTLELKRELGEGE